MYMSDKNIDYRLYLYLLELSNFNVDSKDTDYRYLYKNKLNKNRDKIISDMQISERVYNKKLKKLRDNEIIEYIQVNDQICIKIRVKTDNMYYVLLSETEIFKLKQLKSNAIKTYLVLKYTQEQQDKYTKIQLIYIAGKLNLSLKNTTTILNYLNDLKDIYLIDYYTYKSFIEILDKNSNSKYVNLKEYFYKCTPEIIP